MCVFFCVMLWFLFVLYCVTEGITGIARKKNCSDREAQVLMNLMLIVVASCF